MPYIRGKLLSFRKWALAIAVLSLSAYSLFKAATAGNTAYVDEAFWPLAALVLVLSTREISINALDSFFRFIFFYGIAATAFEVFLFVAIGRLPALAYHNSLAVRFGAFLDDPNGFAAIWYMLMGWAFYRYSGLKRWLVEFVLLICVLLTQSLTAFGFLILLSVLIVIYFTLIRPKPLLILCLSAVFGTILIATWSRLVAIFSLIAETRQGSVDQHLSQITGTSGPNLDWLFGAATYKAYESWWVGSLLNFGGIWYLANLVVILSLVVGVFKAFHRAHDSRHRAVMSGILMFSCYFVFADLNLPLFLVFPINFLFFSFAYLIFFEKAVQENQPDAASLVSLPRLSTE